MEQAQSTSAARRFEELTNLFYLMVALPLVAFIWVYLNLRDLQPWGYFADPFWRVFVHVALLALALALGVLAFVQYRKRFSGLEPEAENGTSANSRPRGVKGFSDHASSQSKASDNGSSQAEGGMLSPQLSRKFEVFKSASMQKYLLLTASTVLVVLGYYLSAEEVYGAFYAVMIIIFSVHRPTPDRFMRDMRLAKEDRQAVRAAINHGRRLPEREGK